MRKGHKLSPQSHFTCLFHDHAKCSCIGGPRRLVQSHFTCHSHEWSSSLFFVMHVHRTYTSIRVSCICMGCSVLASFLVFSSCCSSVSVSAPTFGSDVFALSYRCFSIRNIPQQICLSSFQHTRNNRPSCRHISSSCCLLLLCGTRTHAAFPPRFHGR